MNNPSFFNFSFLLGLQDYEIRTQRPQKPPLQLFKVRDEKTKIEKIAIFHDLFHICSSLNHQKLNDFEVLQPREYDRTLRHVSAVLLCKQIIKVHGMGPDL